LDVAFVEDTVEAAFHPAAFERDHTAEAAFSSPRRRLVAEGWGGQDE